VTAPDANRLLRVFSGARLGLAVLLLTLGPFLPAELVPGMNVGIVMPALLAAIMSSGALFVVGALAQPRRVAWLVCLLDVVLITAVVAATGGPQSIFTFLYVLSVIAACVLLSRTGGLAMAGTASVLYIGLVFGRTIFPMTAFFEPPQETTALEVLTMFMNTGTFLIVAIVAGGLAERFHETREELETRRKDLLDLQAFKDLIFHSVSTGLIALDHEYRITAFNRAAEEITGRRTGQAIGRPWSELFGSAIPLQRIEATIAQAARAAARYEATVTRPDGTEIPVRLTFSPLSSGDGRQLGLIAACEDLSVIREMEARMRQADRLASLGRMAANIAHEIRNPLASLTGAIEALTGTLGAADERERLSQIVVRESDRLNEIIRSFLQYARPAPLAPERVNVAEALDEVLLLLEHRPLPPTIKVVRDFAASIPWTLDAQQFRQAVWNLCLNAVEAMPDGGELQVGAAVQREQLEVWVTDSGEGIAAQDVSQIFEPFFSTKAGGSGLGLALVHRIVTDHGGHVDVRSAPGLGTTMTLTLPARHA
jgi:two-component system sensor histidine kinase PilS (NtrC family)